MSEKTIQGSSIVTKLIAQFMIFGLVVTGIVSFINFRLISDSLLTQQLESLDAVRKSRQRSVENYLNTTQQQLLNFSRDETIVSASKEFNAAFDVVLDQATSSSTTTMRDELRDYYDEEYLPRLAQFEPKLADSGAQMPEDPTAQLLQWMYIADNPHSTGEKLHLDAASIPCDYNTVHLRYHSRIRSVLQSFLYYDMFLLDLNGNLVYSVDKETDFATNMLTGPYADSGLARLYRRIVEAPEPDTVYVEDFSFYRPSYNSPAYFVGAGLYDGDTLQGVAAFQLPADELNAIMSDTFGLGDTGETYIVGRNHLMRSNGRFSDESTVLKQPVNTVAVVQALQKGDGYEIVADYRGTEVISSFGPVQVEGLDWVMLAEMDLSEVLIPIGRLKERSFALVLSFGLLLILFFTWTLRKQIANPINTLMTGAGQVRGGKYDTTVTVQTKDEFAVLAETFNTMTQAIKGDIEERERNLQEISRLRGMLPICASCKKVRDEEGYWSGIEKYVTEHSEAEFTHTLCSECAEELYTDIDSDKKHEEGEGT